MHCCKEHTYRNEEDKKKLINRLKKAEGQIRGIQKMVSQSIFIANHPRIIFLTQNRSLLPVLPPKKPMRKGYLKLSLTSEFIKKLLCQILVFLDITAFVLMTR